MAAGWKWLRHWHMPTASNQHNDSCLRYRLRLNSLTTVLFNIPFLLRRDSCLRQLWPLSMGTRKQTIEQILNMSWPEANLRRAAQLLDIFNFAIPNRLQLFEFCDLQA